MEACCQLSDGEFWIVDVHDTDSVALFKKILFLHCAGVLFLGGILGDCFGNSQLNLFEFRSSNLQGLNDVVVGENVTRHIRGRAIRANDFAQLG